MHKYLHLSIINIIEGLVYVSIVYTSKPHIIVYLRHIILVFLLKKHNQVEREHQFYNCRGIDIIQIFYNLNSKCIQTIIIKI